MGYAGSNLLENGSKSVGVNFIGINGNPGSTMLSDLKVAGYTLAEEDGASFEGLVYAMKLDGIGKTVEDDQGQPIMWQWGDWYEMDENDETKLVRRIGWMDANGDFLGKKNLEDVDIPDVPLAMGEGVWINSDSATWQIQCAGEVYNATVPIELLENGSKFCANACPANIGLSKTFIGNYALAEEADAAFEGTVYAMKLDGIGKTVEDDQGQPIMWQWGDWYEVDENDETKLVRKIGWMDANGDFLGKKNLEGVMIPDVPLDIGEGVWVNSDSTTWQFVFPNVFEL